MSHPAEARCLERAAELVGAQIEADDHKLTVELAGARAVISLPEPKPAKWDNLDFGRAVPGRPRGDQRETLLHYITQDAAASGGLRSGISLRQQLGADGVLPAADARTREVLGEVLAYEYWVTPAGRGGRTGTQRPIPFPLQAAIPLNYTLGAGGTADRYKMFRGNILLFLCFADGTFQREPIDELIALMNSRDDMSLLDEALVDAAIKLAGHDAKKEASAEMLLASEQANRVREGLTGGAFCPEPMARFREDLLVTLRMPLPRQDRINAVIHTLSLHLALYYYEVAFLLGQGVDALVHAAAGHEPPPRLAFEGRLRFRVEAEGDRPVSGKHPCAASWRELDERYLYALGVNTIVANYLHDIWESVAGPQAVKPDPAGLGAAMHRDVDLRALVDSTARALAVLFASRGTRTGVGSGELERIADSPLGVHALRETVRTYRRSSLKRPGRDIVNQLAKRSFGGSLIRKRGPVSFFELDEEFLFLLVRWIVAREGRGDSEVPLAEFLRGLRCYGLAPQNGDEMLVLTATLERLGMLQRYSDAGEATYVRHVL